MVLTSSHVANTTVLDKANVTKMRNWMNTVCVASRANRPRSRHCAFAKLPCRGSARGSVPKRATPDGSRWYTYFHTNHQVYI